jgi:hypothetical protein
MTKKFSIPIHKSVVRMLLEGTVDINQYFDENYAAFESKLNYCLLEYHQGVGGSQTLFESHIDDENDLLKFDLESLEGTFHVNYEIEYYFGCDDINRIDKHHMNWKFTIDKSDFTITFEGEPDWEIDN